MEVWKRAEGMEASASPHWGRAADYEGFAWLLQVMVLSWGHQWGLGKESDGGWEQG